MKNSSRISKKIKSSTKSKTPILDDVDLSAEQLKIFHKLEKSHDNYFITGKAGTGKSVLLTYFVSHTKKKVAVLAPTGVSALNVGGQTIHSFFQLELGVQNYQNIEKVTDLKDKQTKIIQKLDALVIDEISMVSADVMDMIDAKMRFARGINSPFGGVQIIAFGDLLQLPPVAPKGGALEFMRDHYRSIYFFDSNVVKNNPFEIIELSEVYRQTDPTFIDILARIRTGQVDWDLIKEINESCLMAPPDDDFITLSSMNAIADRINESRLLALPGEPHMYNAFIKGQIKPGEYPAPESLVLREGAHIMMVKNDRVDPESRKNKQRWVNGTMAVISRLTDDRIWIQIGPKEYEVDLEEWEKYHYTYDPETGLFDKEPIASFSQYPIKLAYAMTIHKSQGQTYDSVKIDLGRGAFATGQTYVALSRCRSLERLYLERPLRLSDIRVDRRVIEFLGEDW